jgi:hypothetical protein
MTLEKAPAYQTGELIQVKQKLKRLAPDPLGASAIIAMIAAGAHRGAVIGHLKADSDRLFCRHLLQPGYRIWPPVLA